RSPTELLTGLLPIDRLDEEGLALYRSVVSSVDDEAFRRGAVLLIERLCELGYMRRLSRAESDGTVRLTYRNLLTLDTVSISFEQPVSQRETQQAADTGPRAAPPKPEACADEKPIRRIDEPPRAAMTLSFLRAVAASSRRTDLAGALGYLYDLLKDAVGADRVALAMSRGLASSQMVNLTEFEEVCVSDEGDQVAPPDIREKVEETGEALSIQDIRRDSRHLRYFPGRASGALAVAPLKADAYVYGTLAIWSSRSYAFDSNSVAVLQFVAEFAAGLVKRRLEVEELIFIDQTCQIHNRRYFDEQLTREIERSKRTGNAMALLIGDLDDFKSVNDTLGHAAGDSVLRQVGKILSENARQVDIVARHGGEEFGVILPDITREGALVVAERIRSTIAMHAFITGSEQQPTWDLTISIGGALYPLDATSRVDLMDKADRIALYQAKHLGKNRVVMYEDTLS
ncbi:MAG: sensor domain-containing diguanylate cyclase, partial [Candidatus Eisenbacteria bacterium]|nr:sensor domain-containing diguanylate cyclase [Candidatus Eisenbacteria bacterium]